MGGDGGDARSLLELDRRHSARIVLVPEIGDFVPMRSTLFHDSELIDEINGPV